MNATEGAFGVTVDKERTSDGEYATRNSRYPLTGKQKRPASGLFCRKREVYPEGIGKFSRRSAF